MNTTCKCIYISIFPYVVPWQVDFSSTLNKHNNKVKAQIWIKDAKRKEKQVIHNMGTQLKQDMTNMAHKVTTTIWDCVQNEEAMAVKCGTVPCCL